MASTPIIIVRCSVLDVLAQLGRNDRPSPRLAVFEKGSVLYFVHFLVACWDMARKLRVEYEGAIYHVMNRGDWWEHGFKSGGGARVWNGVNWGQ
jgi:hypothetical protein